MKKKGFDYVFKVRFVVDLVVVCRYGTIMILNPLFAGKLNELYGDLLHIFSFLHFYLLTII